MMEQFVSKRVPEHLLLIDTLLWSMKSRHRAKADVCFSKQCAQSEDEDGNFMHTSGP